MFENSRPSAARKLDQPCTAQSANFGKFWLNSQNLAGTILHHSVVVDNRQPPPHPKWWMRVVSRAHYSCFNQTAEEPLFTPHHLSTLSTHLISSHRRRRRLSESRLCCFRRHHRHPSSPSFLPSVLPSLALLSSISEVKSVAE